MTASAENVYLEALKRLKEKNKPISLNRVAVEAVKKSGSLRPARYPRVCEEVQRTIDEREASKKNKPKKKKDLDRQYDELKELHESNRARYHISLHKILNLENQLFEVPKVFECLSR